MIGLVIFDCDGVLIDSEPVTEAIMARDLATRGLDIAPRDCAGLFTRGTMQSAGEEAAKRGATIPADWVTNINAQVAAELARGVPLLPDLWDLLHLLQARGIATAIASNGPQSKMRASLTPSGLWDHFDGRI